MTVLPLPFRSQAKPPFGSPIVVRLANRLAKTRSEGIHEIACGARRGVAERRNRIGAGDGGKVGVAAAGVAGVANAVVDGESGPNLPGVAKVDASAPILLSAGGQAELRPLGAESLAVAEDHYGSEVGGRVGWIAAAANADGTFREGSRSRHFRTVVEEGSESAAENPVDAGSETGAHAT